MIEKEEEEEGDLNSAQLDLAMGIRPKIDGEEDEEDDDNRAKIFTCLLIFPTMLPRFHRILVIVSIFFIF